MKKYSMALLLVQLAASALILLTEAKALDFDPCKKECDLADERDIEVETNRESDGFPDIISFASKLYQ